jgi:hypothetical protein
VRAFSIATGLLLLFFSVSDSSIPILTRRSLGAMLDRCLYGCVLRTTLQLVMLDCDYEIYILNSNERPCLLYSMIFHDSVNSVNVNKVYSPIILLDFLLVAASKVIISSSHQFNFMNRLQPPVPEQYYLKR